jgi:hypothetical protein
VDPGVAALDTLVAFPALGVGDAVDGLDVRTGLVRHAQRIALTAADPIVRIVD